MELLHIFICILKDDEYHVVEYTSEDTYISEVFPDFKISLNEIIG